MNMKAWIAALLLAQSAWAARPEKAMPASLTATASPFPAKVTLKDGQSMKGEVLSYDAFFLVVAQAGGRKFDLPWREIAEVTLEEFSGDDAMMRQYLTPERVAVASVIQPRDPGAALAKAFWPGVLLHGYGHKQAGESEVFFSLAGAGIFGGLMGGFGLARALDAGVSESDKELARYLAWGGGAIFTISWLWDLSFAASAARKFNAKHGLAIAPAPGGVALGTRLEF